MRTSTTGSGSCRRLNFFKHFKTRRRKWGQVDRTVFLSYMSVWYVVGTRTMAKNCSPSTRPSLAGLSPPPSHPTKEWKSLLCLFWSKDKAVQLHCLAVLPKKTLIWIHHPKMKGWIDDGPLEEEGGDSAIENRNSYYQRSFSMFYQSLPYIGQDEGIAYIPNKLVVNRNSMIVITYTNVKKLIKFLVLGIVQ